MDVLEILQRLNALHGPAGEEKTVAEAIRAMAEPYADDIRVDTLGNLIVHKKGNGPRVMFAAHMDSIGFLVTHIEEDGFLRVNQVGGVDRKLYASSCVTVHTASGPLSGVISSVPPHLRKEEKELPASDEVAVDLGLSGERARELVCPGDRVTIDCEPAVLLDGSVSAKALDDRACCAAVILAAEELAGKDLPLELSYVFTTMEEVGSQGAVTAAGEIAPDYAVALDVSFAVTPDVPARNCGKMGGGVMLGIAPILDNGETDRVRRVAKEQELPLQFEVMGGSTGTDADCIAASGSGVRTVLFSIPQKYMHTPVETVAPEDVKATAELLCAYITDLARDLAKEGN